MRETPSAHAQRAGGRVSERRDQSYDALQGLGGGGGERTVRHALHKADVEANLVLQNGTREG